MSKSALSMAGVIELLDTPEVTLKKFDEDKKFEYRNFLLNTSLNICF